MSISKIICMKHPSYDGMNNPDLTCNACCSKFVMRIRAEQAEKANRVELVKNVSAVSVSSASNSEAGRKPINFTPMFESVNLGSKSARTTNFDGSWI
jgi:hypothetical protein